jgi:hypothetical protein
MYNWDAPISNFEFLIFPTSANVWFKRSLFYRTSRDFDQGFNLLGDF